MNQKWTRRIRRSAAASVLAVVALAPSAGAGVGIQPIGDNFAGMYVIGWHAWDGSVANVSFTGSSAGDRYFYVFAPWKGLGIEIPAGDCFLEKWGNHLGTQSSGHKHFGWNC